MQSVFNRTMEHVYPLLNDPRHFAQPLILFQHIPLHKEAGICVDSPSIVYDEYVQCAMYPSRAHSTNE